MAKESSSREPQRLVALDGLRGWASLSVAIYHFTWETFGARFAIFRNPFTAMLFDGRLAIALFFGISGYVLTSDGWGPGDKRQVRQRLLKRYPRLAIPVLACCLTVFALMVAGATADVAPAAAALGREDWLGTFLQFPADLGDALRYALGRAFLLDRGNDYDPFLWTMTYELWGSAAVLCVCWWERRLIGGGYLALSVLAVACAFTFPLAITIPLGALAGRLHRDGLMFAPDKNHGASLPGVVLIVVGLAGAAALELRGAFPPFGIAPVFTGCMGMLVLLGALQAPAVRTFLAGRSSRFLGRLSFPIYLAQFPVLASVTAFLVVEADGQGLLTVATAFGIATLSLGLTFALAIMFFLPVERLTSRFNRRLDALAVNIRRRAMSTTVAPAE